MLLLIPLLPLLGFLLNSLAGRRLPRELSGGLASLAMLGSFGVSVMAVRALLLVTKTLLLHGGAELPPA